MGLLIITCLGGLVAGVLFACGIPGSHLLWYLVPLFAGATITLLWRPYAWLINRYKLISGLAGFSLFFLAGSIAVMTTSYHPGEDLNSQAVIRAKIVSYREVTENMGQLVVRVRQQKSGVLRENRTGRMVLLVRPDPLVSWRSGDLWEFGPMTISPVSSKPSKSGFIPQRYWLSRGVRYEARLPSGHARLLKACRVPALRSYFAGWQEILSLRIDRLSLSGESRALVKAMILGDRSEIDSSTIDDFSRAGIIHVLSVSGLHVGIIYFIISWVLKRLVFFRAGLRSVICLVVVWIYAGVTGFSPSALRSAGMITLFELARMGRRGTPALEVLASTAVIHILMDPFTVFSAGAQLSYLAVAGIFIWNPVFNPILANQNRIVRYFAGSIAISLSAQSLIIPVLLFWFGWFPLYFLIGNLVLLPLMILAFYLGLLVTAVEVAGISIPPLGAAIDLLTGLAMDGASWLGALPGNLFQPKGLIWPDLVLYYLLLLIIRSYLDRPDQRKVKRMLAGTCILLVVRYGGLLLAA